MKTASTQLYDALFESQSPEVGETPSPGIGLMVVGLIQENREFECLVDSAQSRALYAQSTQRRFSRFTWTHPGILLRP